MHVTKFTSSARITRLLTLLIACVGVANIAGCSRGPAAAEVKGSVSYQGKLVKDGTIRFFPTGEGMGQGAGAEIVEGQYTISLNAGLVEGSYVVTLSAVEPTGRQIPRLEVDPGESATMAEAIQVLPAKYTTPGEVTAELKGGENVQDFNLQR